jgi:hypothetical protein
MTERRLYSMPRRIGMMDSKRAHRKDRKPSELKHRVKIIPWRNMLEHV